MEDYLRGLQKQLKGFQPEERDALIEEVRSHIETGESDPSMGDELNERRQKLISEMGSPEDLGHGLRAIYRPNRLVDYLLAAIPYLLSLYFTALYTQLSPQYPWMDIRLNVIFDLVLIAVGLSRRSVLVTLFWINIAVMQLFYIALQGVWQPYWYFGTQTILWAALLIALLALLGQAVWKNRRDALITVYALLPLAMQLFGTAVWSIQPVNYIYNPLDRTLLMIYLEMQGGNSLVFGTLVTMAVFFLASNRAMRWLALYASALIMGLGRVYLFDYRTGTVALVAQWVYYLYCLLPLTGVCGAWLLDYFRRIRQMRPAA
jgi:HAAS domain-containing protein